MLVSMQWVLVKTAQAAMQQVGYEANYAPGTRHLIAHRLLQRNIGCTLFTDVLQLRFPFCHAGLWLWLAIRSNSQLPFSVKQQSS